MRFGRGLLLFVWTTTHVVRAFVPTTVSSFASRNRGPTSSSSSSSSTCRKTPLPTCTARFASTTNDDNNDNKEQQQQPMAIATGHSTNSNLVEALQEAVTMATQSLPTTDKQPCDIQLALVSVSSLYDGQQPSTVVVPAVLAAAQVNHCEIQHLVGSSVAGCLGSSSDSSTATSSSTFEYEGQPCVSITLMVLPETHLQTFHLDHIPDATSPPEFAKTCGLPLDWVQSNNKEEPVTFLLLPAPSFSPDVDDLLWSLHMYFPGSTVVGGMASTVSSLSRAKLYYYNTNTNTNVCCVTDGSVGVAIQGDLHIEHMLAQGAKPVGGVYQIVAGQDSTVQVIVLDEAATQALEQKDDNDEKDDDDDREETNDSEETNENTLSPAQRKAAAAQAYAKARIPKPILAEANFVMKTLSDDDQAFMRRQLLLGLEQGARTPAQALQRQSQQDNPHQRFTIQQVASAGMKDGSVTLPLGSVQVQPGTKMRFFVREATFAKQEVQTLWLDYQKQKLNQQFGVTVDSTNDDDDNDNTKKKKPFTPAACWMVPTLDRGSKFFKQEGYESQVAARCMPTLPLSGFFSNGVLLHGQPVQGSASGYFLLGSKSGRPIYNKEQELRQAEQKAKQDSNEASSVPSDATPSRSKPSDPTTKAPRDEHGELILKRREVHSGRALTVSTVEWSVAEKTAVPTSALEGYMWDKETEVDRFRERVPLSNLVSQCRLSASDPTLPKPRDFMSALLASIQDHSFVVVPELKQTDPATGSLHRRFDLEKQTRGFTRAGAPAMMVNCDPILFGGSLDDIQTVREVSSKAAVEQMNDDDGVVVPPVLALDLILYPYQLYKLRLAGADAVNLITGALAQKDLVYLTKIASSLQLQVTVTVTSEVQIDAVAALPAGSFDGVILSNRLLEDYGYDLSGEQALNLLQSDALAALQEKHGDLPVLVHGRVGLIERGDGGDAQQYIKELRQAGAAGAIIGGGLAGKDPAANLQALQEGL